MARKGYLANLFTVPPLIFKFQFHPEILSEKKGFEYREAPELGKWAFDKSVKAAGITGGSALARAAKVAGAALDDFKHFGSLLVATKAMDPTCGRPRTFALEFALDARARPDDPTTFDAARRGRIEPDLAVLRSFMNPTLDIPALLAGQPIWAKPPTCQLKLGDVELECVMNDLNIKITKFKPDLTPERAEVSLTLSEQTRSLSTVIDVLTRGVEVVGSYGRLSGEDVLQQIPGWGFVQDAFD
ncbi:hypothetical protein ALI22I_01175 [Saccharothrix sp. ALI-22-I]|uniref:hypothetical protein n=1 Tax=Saccharothrix sp. ALI-22-I TaxID=1933778 RepID=UPI00097C46A6|nr:hypothetical protein [Saccharothrix sp. ALI-22-I]ONI92915.1 hypothetical protein ALI22I_01175 [Saccharothrix sp. ALI-22-I]